MGVIRHADAGYDVAKEKAIAHDLDLIDKLRKA
jgi:urocanate hydratase